METLHACPTCDHPTRGPVGIVPVRKEGVDSYEECPTCHGWCWSKTFPRVHRKDESMWYREKESE